MSDIARLLELESEIRAYDRAKRPGDREPASVTALRNAASAIVFGLSPIAYKRYLALSFEAAR